jgi:hypothetical protein
MVGEFDIVIDIVRDNLYSGRYQYIIYTQQLVSRIEGVGKASSLLREAVVKILRYGTIGIRERHVVEIATDNKFVGRRFEELGNLSCLHSARLVVLHQSSNNTFQLGVALLVDQIAVRL